MKILKVLSKIKHQQEMFSARKVIQNVQNISDYVRF